MTTHIEDLIDRFTLRMEEMRGASGVHGPARLLHDLVLHLVANMIRLLVSVAEQQRNGMLADAAPAGAREQPRAWPADLRWRESGWLEHRSPEDACGGGTMHGQFERPEMPPEMKEPIAEPPCRMPVVEQPAGLPLPRRAWVRKLMNSSGPAPARPQHVDSAARSVACRAAGRRRSQLRCEKSG
jgi:hypothetical protein